VKNRLLLFAVVSVTYILWMIPWFEVGKILGVRCPRTNVAIEIRPLWPWCGLRGLRKGL